MRLPPYLARSSATAFLLVGLSGCVSVRTISASASNSMPVVYDQGVATLTSAKQSTVVVRAVYPTIEESLQVARKKLPAMFVGFLNQGPAIVDFSTANVQVMSGKKAVHVYTYEELNQVIERRARMARFAVGFNAGMQSAAASMPSRSYESGTATIHGNGGTATAEFSGTAVSYNPALSAIAQVQIQQLAMAQMQLVEQGRAARLEQIGAVLRRNTVAPASGAGGLVAFESGDIETKQPLRVLVTVAGESHEFLFDVTDQP